jgi:hypothetical protein
VAAQLVASRVVFSSIAPFSREMALVFMVTGRHSTTPCRAGAIHAREPTPPPLPNVRPYKGLSFHCWITVRLEDTSILATGMLYYEVAGASGYSVTFWQWRGFNVEGARRYI